MFNYKKMICCVLSATTVVGVAPVASNAADNSVDLQGGNRFETANKIALNYFKKADNVILVNSDAIPDALSVAPYAKKLNAPVLLTKSDSLDKKTKETLEQLNSKKIILIGGEKSLSKNLENNLKKDYTVERISGSDRINTSLQIANKMGQPIKNAFVVNGYTGLADAAGTGGIAAKLNVPLVFTDKNIDRYKNSLNDLNINNVFLIGGTYNLPEGFNNVVNSERIAGSNRRDTNAKLIEKFFGKDYNSAFIAKDGSNNESELIDSVTIGGVAGLKNMPIFLGSKTAGLTNEQLEQLKASAPKHIVGVGGGNKTAGNQIEKQLPNAQIDISEITSKPSEDEEVPSSGGGGGGGGGGSSTNTEQDKKNNILSKANTHLNTLVGNVAGNEAVSEYATISFNPDSMETDIVSKEITTLPNNEDLNAISGTGFITGLKETPNLVSYSIGDKKTVIKGENNESTLKESIINDVLAQFKDTDLNNIDENKTIIVTANYEDGDIKLSQDYKFNFDFSKIKEAIEKEENLNNKKKKILSNSNKHLDSLVNTVADNEAIKQYADISFNSDSMVTNIVSSELTKLPNDEDLKAISGTGFIKGLKDTPNLLSYSIDGKKTVIKGENNENELKNSIINDVLAQFKDIDSLSKLPDKKTITVTANYEDGDIKLSQDYKFNFDFSKIKEAIEKEENLNNKKKKILSNSNKHLDSLVNTVADNEAIKQYADISFNSDSMVTNIVSSELTKLPNDEDLKAISGTGFIKGLKDTPNLLSYSIDGKETVIKGENNENELKNSIINDVLAQFKDIDSLSKLPEKKTITVTANYEDGDIKLSQDYKFNFDFSKIKEAIEKEENLNNKKKKILSNSNKHLASLVNTVADNKAIKQYADISFNSDSMVTNIVSSELTKLPNDEDLKAISGTGFIKGLKDTPNLLSYSIDGKKTVIKGENNENELKNSIINDVLAQFKDIDSLSNLPENKTITVTANFEDGDVKFSQDYKFNFDFSKIKNAIEKEIQINTENEAISKINISTENLSVSSDIEKKKLI